MKLTLQKSFRIVSFLNENQPWYIKGPVAVIGYVFTLIATFSHQLAYGVYQCFWTKNDFKLGMRRIAWFSRRSWVNLDVSQDDFFDITEGFSDSALESLEGFVERRKPRLLPVTYAADMAFIAARRLDNNESPADRDGNVAALEVSCQALLDVTSLDVPEVAASVARVGDFPIERAKQTLGDFVDLFPTDEVPWFLVSGTFLGLIREHGFLPHDYDIDLGIFEDEADIPSISRAIEDSEQFVLKKYDHHKSKLIPAPVRAKNPDVPYILKIIHISGVHIDLFIHYRDTSKTPEIHWHGSSLHRWENSAFELKPYRFYNWTVLGPSNSDAYLTENYGDWRTPVTEFNCTTDTPNLAIVRHPIAVVIFLKRLVLNRAKDPNDAAKLELALLQSGFLSKTANGSLEFSGELFLEGRS